MSLFGIKVLLKIIRSWDLCIDHIYLYKRPVKSCTTYWYLFNKSINQSQTKPQIFWLFCTLRITIITLLFYHKQRQNISTWQHWNVLICFPNLKTAYITAHSKSKHKMKISIKIACFLSITTRYSLESGPQLVL